MVIAMKSQADVADGIYPTSPLIIQYRTAAQSYSSRFFLVFWAFFVKDVHERVCMAAKQDTNVSRGI